MMPVLFVGHGSPMNAIENNEFSRVWEQMSQSIPKPRAILCISAHWESEKTKISGNANPDTIHDFYGFPQSLYEIKYPAPGSPTIAEEIVSHIRQEINLTVEIDPRRGLDHGAWSILRRLFPKADIPVLQLSLNYNEKPQYHYNIGIALQKLRSKNILVIGSGNIVHNLGRMNWNGAPYEWAIKFKETINDLILHNRSKDIIYYDELNGSKSSVPTNEHFLPLLYTLGMRRNEDSVNFLNDKIVMGSISMTCVKLSGTEENP